MNCIFTPSTCHINLGALQRNFHRLGKPENLMPVIKADAYGHGLVPVAKALDQAGAVRFAVGTVSEAMTLRQEGFAQDALPLLGCLDETDWQNARHIVPVIGNFADLEIARNLARPDKPWKIAVKCDTGMGRLGFSSDETGQLLEMLQGSPQLEPVFLLSHFACADMPEKESFTLRQKQVFHQFYSALRVLYPDIKQSIANSAATLGAEHTAQEIARPGLALYGGNPLPGENAASLEWVMSLSAPLMHIKTLKAGQSLSYGCTFVASKPMKVAVAGIGYAQGLNRSLSNRMEVLLHGRRIPQVGRICMGMMMVDVTAVPEARPGDRIWILGGQPMPGAKPVTPDEIAELSGTISYEILCLLGSLNPRTYIN